ncbi:PREDICTED: uncharacterized protein LOC106751164 [Dinoponera quadriceps]|uniref:Uncharacterized protein LOC106751164 n=1 Tax=Dinoponera quadriceps TaxID=609295 RepID=A0A6P3YC86_DINQU|nr:PREDICTED: uncharacterized protein LOC106751164 [Dinoponera quadriceps]
MDTLLMATSYLPDFRYTLLAIIFTTLIALHYYIETRHAELLSLKLSHPQRVPIIGHALLYREFNPEDLIITASKYFAKYGPVMPLHLKTQVDVFLTEAQEINIIYATLSTSINPWSTASSY